MDAERQLPIERQAIEKLEKLGWLTGYHGHGLDGVLSLLVRLWDQGKLTSEDVKKETEQMVSRKSGLSFDQWT